MSTPRKPTAGFWIVVWLLLMVGYPLSCPWSGVFYQTIQSPESLTVARAYHGPLMRILNRSPEPISEIWIAYRDWCYRIAGAE